MGSYIESDLFTDRKSGYAELIEKKAGKQEMFGTVETAGIFKVSDEVIRAWTEEGRLLAINTNVQRASRVNPGKPMRPTYFITKAAIMDLAERLERGQ